LPVVEKHEHAFAGELEGVLGDAVESTPKLRKKAAFMNSMMFNFNPKGVKRDSGVVSYCNSASEKQKVVLKIESLRTTEVSDKE
jgi:hypothetical protein